MPTINNKPALAIGMILAALVPAIASWVVPGFRETFASFGAELPLLTRFFVNHTVTLWMLPVLVLAAWLFWPRRERRGLAALLVGAGSLLVFPVMVFAMYLPIFSLSQAI